MGIVGAADMSGLGRQYPAAYLTAYPTRLSQQVHAAPSHSFTAAKKEKRKKDQKRKKK